MRKNPSRYALMALAGLLSVFGLVLMVKMRDGGRALAQSAEPPLAVKSVPVDAKEKKGDPKPLPPLDALALPAPGTVTSTSAAAPPVDPPAISTVGAVDVPVPMPSPFPPPVNVTGAVPPSPMGSETKPIIIPAVAKEPAGPTPPPPPAVDVAVPGPVPVVTPPTPPTPTPPVTEPGKALPPIMVDVTTPKPAEIRPTETKPGSTPPSPPAFGTPTSVPSPIPTPAPVGTTPPPPVSVDPVPPASVPDTKVPSVTPPSVTPPTTPVSPTVPPATAGGEEEVSVLPSLRAPKVKPTIVLPLTGTFTVTADGGKTITLPDAIRKQLGECETVLVSPGSGADRCLWLTNQTHLDRLQSRLDKSPAKESEVRGFVRLYYAQTVKLPVKDGKVAVTDKLATFAGLGAECVLVGIDDHFEIWDAAKWKRYTQAKKSTGSDD